MGKAWEDENGKVFCPANECDCPYYKKDGVCSLENVEKECDDFYFYWLEELDYDEWKRVYS